MRWIVAATAIAAGCSGSSGGSDSGADSEEVLDGFGTARWQVVCPEGTDGCVDSEPGNVNGDASEVDLGCSVRSERGTMMGFRVSDGLSTVVGEGIHFSEGRPGTGLSVWGCAVSFSDGDHTYSASGDECGSGDPGAEQPCRVSVMVDEESEGGPWIQLGVLCRAVESGDDPSIKRGLALPEDVGGGAQFAFTGCGDGS